MYYSYDLELSNYLNVLLFIPQWLLVTSIGVLFYFDLTFTMLAQAAAFVVFNKVMSLQYLIWYIALTPFSFPIITDRLREKMSSEKLADRIRKMTKKLQGR